MDRTEFTAVFSVEHGGEGRGEPWDTASLVVAVVETLKDRFQNDGLRIDKIEATATVEFRVLDGRDI